MIEKTKQPKVSVCIPCFNADSYVAAAVHSVIKQTYCDLELVIVDDGSTDRSGALIKQMGRSDDRIKFLSAANSGQCAAANRAFAASSGDYIKFFDADDIMHPQMIEKQMAMLNESDCDIASAGWGRFYGEDLSTFTLNPQSVWRDMDARDWLVEAWTDARPMMQCALWLIPRKVLEKTGGWDEELSLINDFEFFARVLSQAANIRFTPDVPLMYRSGLPGSLSGRKTDAALDSAFKSLMLGTSHLLSARDDGQARRSCANVLQDFIYTYYPRRPELRAQMKSRIAELGGSDLAPDGPPNFHRLRKLVGWKLARKIQNLANS